MRVALGATARRIVLSVLGETTRLACVGGAIGLSLAIAAAQRPGGALDHLLDVRVLVSAMATLFVAAGLATLMPAWRASRVDPARSLRRDG